MLARKRAGRKGICSADSPPPKPLGHLGSLSSRFPEAAALPLWETDEAGKGERKTIRLTRNLARELSLSNPITTIKAAAYLWLSQPELLLAPQPAEGGAPFSLYLALALSPPSL